CARRGGGSGIFDYW
nr:immunoglobulin heavy chain junction region [Macaca mulatta]MOW22599.1 immunoglobulin heavy chain junction region [Macaca mulatta]MOW22601.1 immunoglobulin heavy chain junction region [Macaca mulatta]MOW22626.1 immunoglobulin heavy chain junction region [Macaca mulatta]MOW22665.1 immunoglobulin heavy chain junction region [Macaca mulatta]